MVARLRLATGLVLVVFLATHLLNHTLGLWSLQLMEDGLGVFLAIWGWPTFGFVLVLASLVVHTAIALRGLYRRRSLRLQPWEAAQLVLGLLVPIFLVEHVLGTRGANIVYDLGPSYRGVLLGMWVAEPEAAFFQTLLVIVAWAHGMIGLHYWLRLRPWYARVRPYAFAAALLLPALALGGFVAAGMQLRREALAAGGLDQLLAAAGQTAEIAAFAHSTANVVFVGFPLLVAAVLAARWLRMYLLRRSGVPHLIYRDGRIIDIAPGATVLETIRAAGLPHASVCGGRGRCSTCRVRVGEGADRLPPPLPLEARVLMRIGAPANVRLACQIRPIADLEVTPLLRANATARDGFAQPGYLSGEEREIAILFADLRDFTRLADAKLPYDVVFVLNRYFAAMGQAVETAGGRLDKFIGDGVMALFGVETGGPQGCRRALLAARGMALKLDELNQALKADLPEPLRMGMGLHVGPVIVGDMGYGLTRGLTAIGDAVNIASRLEDLTKSFGVELVVSEEVAALSGLDLTGFERRLTDIRGRREAVSVRLVPSARDLPTEDAKVPAIALAPALGTA